MSLMTHTHTCPRCHEEYERPLKECPRKGEESICCYGCTEAGFVAVEVGGGWLAVHRDRL